MRLADFILANREPILVEWEAFARTCTPAAGPMDIESLRDHADQMLTVIVADLRQPQGMREQAAKSKGNAPDDASAPSTAAEQHGAGRAESGFSIEQMVSEYRALRASVIRLWTKAMGALETEHLEDLTRFNEAIDQSLAESVTRYTEQLGHSKEMFLAILGHDLRTPLGAIMTSSTFMLETQALQEPVLTLTSRIARSSSRMNSMVGDLLDFTRSRLGGGIPIERVPVDMAKLVQDAVDELRLVHLDRTINVQTTGDVNGEWDAERISQALTNLIGNAVEHGASSTSVNVDVEGHDREVTVAVHNRGSAIPAEQLDGIFNPMKRREFSTSPSPNPGRSGNLGLGLYIADRIITAHSGEIAVKSSEENGTTFTVHLPRNEGPMLEKEKRGRRSIQRPG